MNYFQGNVYNTEKNFLGKFLIFDSSAAKMIKKCGQTSNVYKKLQSVIVQTLQSKFVLRNGFIVKTSCSMLSVVLIVYGFHMTTRFGAKNDRNY